MESRAGFGYTGKGFGTSESVRILRWTEVLLRDEALGLKSGNLKLLNGIREFTQSYRFKLVTTFEKSVCKMYTEKEG